MLICGKKSAVMCAVLSAWGVIMLILLGIFLRTNSVAFAEDLEIDHKDAENRNDYLTQINRKYIAASQNCWIAAGLYGITLVVSFYQYCLNQKARIA